MSGIRSIHRNPTVKGSASFASAPIYVDSDDNRLKIIPAGTGTAEIEVLTGLAPTTVTAATVTLSKGVHANRLTTFNRAAGIVATLPAATGSGDYYDIVFLATATGATTIAVPNATDYMIGTALLFQDGGDTTVGFATANSGTVATESDTITLFATANATGGIKGCFVRLIDIAPAVWAVEYVSDAGGTEATPFSAGV